MEYLISFIVGLAICGLLLVSRFFIKRNDIVLKIVGALTAAILVARMLCYESVISNSPDSYWGLSSSPLNNNTLTAFSLVLIWMSYTSILFVALRPFFNVKFANNIVRFIVPINLVAQVFLLRPMCTILQGVTDSKLLLILYSIETAFGIGVSLYYLVDSIIKKEGANYKDILYMFLGYIVLSIFTMPSYFLQYMCGHIVATNGWMFKDLTFPHRILLYGNIIIPFVIFFSLNGRSYEFRKYNLLFMTLGVLIGFCVNYDYTTLSKPWTWPFHLCNTALFILPLVLMFNMKRLFYFTYFINVLGAFLAMVMPNYGDGSNIISMRILNFWYNHYFAFFIPILYVSLKMFDRPKIKEFGFSMLAFFFYFSLVLVLNVVFTDLGHEVDYFFLNSDFIVDKFGTWAEKLFDISVVWKINGHEFVFRPVYQAIFFLTYILLGLGVWFIFLEGYRIADSNSLLFFKLQRMRREEKELKIALAGRSLDEPMEENAGIKYELKNFSKKYGTSRRYAVKDANFEVHGGEIFGFLGPNGAGKSTIIKSTVGIQPITSGNINICGYDVGTQPVQAKSMIGFVPDHYALYEKLTGREYVNYIADIYNVSEEDRNERIENYVKLFELEGSIDNMIKTYSHGMKQKITIMAALVHDPKVWILDEPLTGLDPNSIYQVKECMKLHASKGNIVFFSSHIIDIVEKLCARIAIIKHGEIQCIKTVKEIEDSGLTLEQFYLQTIGDDNGVIPEEEVNDPSKLKKKHKKFSFKNLFISHKKEKNAVVGEKEPSATNSETATEQKEEEK